MKVVNIEINKKNRIEIGRRGEGNVRKIVFDCTYFAETYGSGTAQLLHRRRGDEAPYLVLVEQDGNIVTWTVSESDTANVGIGEAELIWMLPDGNAKSAVYETETLRSLSEPGDPPEPWRAWVDDVIESADRAEAAQKIAESWAHGHADYPERDEDNAKYYAAEVRAYKEAAGEILGKVASEGTNQIKAISTAGEEQIRAIEAAGAEQTEVAKAEIATKGNEVLNSIPKDYAELQTEVGELKGDLADIDELLEHEVIKPYSKNGSATISTSWGYVHVVDNIKLPTAKMYRFTFTIPSATTNIIYCRLRKGTTTFLQLQIKPGNISISSEKYCEPLDIDYLDTTGDINAVGLTVSATIEEIGGETIENSIFDKVEMNPLYGKTVLFNGDSICASATDTEHNLAWAGRIMEHNSMKGKNYAVMGGTISSNNYRNDSSAYHWISASVDTMYSENPNADYIIFEGGTNDADLLGSIINGNTSERLGTFSLGDFSGNYDMNTFCGAFENLCYKATNYWTGKKIGYVVAYKMAGQSGLSSGYTKEKSNRRAYFDIAMQICEKWGIPVLNLWDNCHMNPSNVACYDPSLSETENKATKMIYDGQHPATKGYEYIYPIIESWMKTL